MTRRCRKCGGPIKGNGVHSCEEYKARKKQLREKLSTDPDAKRRLTDFIDDICAVCGGSVKDDDHREYCSDLAFEVYTLWQNSEHEENPGAFIEIVRKVLDTGQTRWRDPQLHIHPQRTGHDPLLIEGNPMGLKALHEALHAVLYGGEDCKGVGQAALYANDGEEYDVIIVERDMERAPLPYTADYHMTPDDAESGWDLVKLEGANWKRK